MPTVTSAREVTGYQTAVVIGGAIAGVAWGATGFVALLNAGPDPGPPGSVSFHAIEGGHALSETGMAAALFGLWRSQRPRIPRASNVLFGIAVAATALIAVVTYVVVVA